ncbi:peroxide stress protein YaaA [Chryseobacterium lacus]|uniref:peroxide stress protein YaaA n=1 Tax=Chryseobacterium lacus TaxID=2058346 RepID=UPI000F88ADC2|nr:peroxide stress protein YaaA [Chryseobacterium lacus]RST28642.1 peroxide stress protein YaaA [Chryseobacterium lacus]
MKIITSPAKLMDITSTAKFPRTTTPKFINEAELIQSHLKEKTPEFLSEMMEISPKLADENWQRNQDWKPNPTAKHSSPALYAFTGEVYRGLDAQTLSEDAVSYLQKNYRILSGLYGLLKPSDKIMLYRLEMGRKFKIQQYWNLYEFWKDKITKQLNSELKSKEIILNLASAEYIKVLDKKKLKAPIINFDFYEMKSGKPKTVVVYTKHARGLMVRFCAENNATTLDDVKAFNLEGYRINEEMSKPQRLVFTR